MREHRLLREADFADEAGKTRIRAQGIEREVRPEAEEKQLASLIGGIEPGEGLIFIAQIGVKLGNSVCGCEPGAALRLTGGNAFPKSLLPSAIGKSLLKGRGEFGFVAAPESWPHLLRFLITLSVIRARARQIVTLRVVSALESLAVSQDARSENRHAHFSQMASTNATASRPRKGKRGRIFPARLAAVHRGDSLWRRGFVRNGGRRAASADVCKFRRAWSRDNSAARDVRHRD